MAILQYAECRGYGDARIRTRLDALASDQHVQIYCDEVPYTCTGILEHVGFNSLYHRKSS